MREDLKQPMEYFLLVQLRKLLYQLLQLLGIPVAKAGGSFRNVRGNAMAVHEA
jgi:hypothetical protein